MMKVKEGRKANKLLIALALAMVLANPSVANAEEVLYTETEDTYTQEETSNVTYEEAAAAVTTTEATATTDSPEVGDVLYEQEGPREFGENEFIDADNWSPELDIDPTAGDTIPEDILDEVDIKLGTTPEPETTPAPETTPVPETTPAPSNPDVTPRPVPTPSAEPEDVPRLGENMEYKNYFLAGVAFVGFAALVERLIANIKKSKAQFSAIKGNGTHEVVSARKKFFENIFKKKLS